MPKAKPSSKATDNVTLSFGLVTLPLTLYSGIVSDAGLSRKEFREVEEDGKIVNHVVGRAPIDKNTDEVIPNSEVVRKVMTDFGPVYVSPEEEETLFSLKPKSMELLCFQPLALMVSGENYIPRGLMYVEPAKTKIGSRKVLPDGTAKAFSMLMKAMREEQVFALIELTSRGVPKPAALMPNGMLWILHHTDAVREQREMPEIEVDEQTVAMGRLLIGTYRVNEVQDLTDKRAELIQAFADEKARAGDFAKPEETAVVAEPAPAPDNLMQLLAASLESVQAPKAETA